MTRKSVQIEIGRIMADLDIEVYRLANRIRSDHVTPLCRRKKWSFSSGMGTWAFFDQNGDPIDDARLPAAVRGMLDAEVYAGQVLGFWIDPVSAEP